MSLRSRTTWLIASTLCASAFAQGTAASAQSKADSGDASARAGVAEPEENPDPNEIVVTAQKRSQLLMQVPMSIATVGGEQLERADMRSVAEFQRLLPGLSSEQMNPGQSILVLRGISTGSANPTVAIYVDDTPFGASTGQANAATLAGDFDTFDIERIEVLRGPQGTLYGASSLGGVMRYITVAPKLDTSEGAVQAGVGSVSGGGMDWSVNGLLNVPVGDKAALRVSGFYRSSGGFIDTPTRDARDINTSDSYGGRASLLIKPTETLSIRLTALLQNLRSDSRYSYDGDPVTFDPLSVDPVSGDPISGFNRADYGVDKTDIDYRLYNAAIDLDLGFATLTSNTSYGRLFQADDADQSFTPTGPDESLGDLITGIYESDEPLGALYSNQITMSKFTQEVRLTSPDSDTVEWVLGGYYTREPGQLFQNFYPFILETREILPAPVAGFDNLVYAQLDSTYKEFAGFGSATWHISPRFDITAGGRWSRNIQDTTTVVDGLLLGGRTEQVGHTTENVFTWSVAPRLDLNDRIALYARVAKGFRPGGPNAPVPGLPEFSSTFRSDTLISYEAGLRGETSDRKFSWDASIYYLDWQNIQVPVVVMIPDVGPINIDGNGDGAKSYGVELSATARPVPGLTMAGNFSYNGNALKGDLADGSGLDGERLPISPKYTANFDLSYEWQAFSDGRANVGVNVNYVGDRVSGYDGGYRATFGANPVLDGYVRIDLRAGIDFGRYNLSLFAKNVTDKFAVANVAPYGDRAGGAISVYPIRPRTIGAMVGARF